MKIGAFTILYNEVPLKELLPRLSALGIRAVELGCGGFSESDHCPVEQLLANKAAQKDLLAIVRDNGMEISALGAQGNPVHPDSQIANSSRVRFEQAVDLASALEVERVLLLSGCPGGAPGDSTPNWITCPWPDDYLKAYAYQWDEVLIPYWRKAAQQARAAGVCKLGIEMHPGMAVFNPETLLRLREACGPEIGCNLDPSHLFWQGIDPVEAVHALGRCIWHVHAKDCAINGRHVRVNGLLSARHYRETVDRPWTFRTVGYGHPEAEWKRILQALSEAGYDYVLSVEHEDMFLSRDEGFERAVGLLKAIVPTQKAGEMWWA